MPISVVEGWLKGELEGIVVERRESKRPGDQPYITLKNPQAWIIHTTEGSTVDGAWNTLDAKGAAPHFIAGENRIVQMRPLWAEGATVHDHNDLGWQVECVGDAKQFQHKLTLPTWRPLVALTKFIHEHKDVPLRRPEGWKDDCSDINTMLATNNTRRQSRKAIGFAGLLGHLDIPDQDPTWHWDPGCLDYSALIEEAGDDMTDEEREQLRRALNVAEALYDGVQDFIDGNTPPADSHLARRRVFRALKDAEARPQPSDHAHPPTQHSHTGNVTVS